MCVQFSEGKQGRRRNLGQRLTSIRRKAILACRESTLITLTSPQDMIAGVESFKAFYGHYPASVLVDKIYLTRANRNYLKEKGIKHYGVPLGRPKEYEASERRYRQQKQNKRSRIEGHFGLAKRNYGLENILMRKSQTSKCQIGLIILGMNIMRMLRDVIFIISPCFKRIKRAWKTVKKTIIRLMGNTKSLTFYFYLKEVHTTPLFHFET